MLGNNDEVITLALGGALIGAGLYWWKASRQAAAPIQTLDNVQLTGSSDTGSGGGWDGTALDSIASSIDGAIYDTTGYRIMTGNWLDDLNGRGASYKGALAAAESANGIPPLLLARLAWQECRFRADIISGATVSSAGAIGIMQIVPKWNPGVNPLDPIASINYAGKKLAGLYRMFGTWELALKAYNWGEGNVKKWLAGTLSQPLETSNYSSQILADVNDFSGGNIA